MALRPGTEDYLDSEKFQIRIRDWDGADRSGQTLSPYLTRLNEIRRAHPALQQLRNVTSTPATTTRCWCSASSAALGGGDDTVIVVSTSTRTDRAPRCAPRHARPRARLGGLVPRHDEITGQDWQWGAHNYVHLDPYVEPAHVLSVRTAP